MNPLHALARIAERRDGDDRTLYDRTVEDALKLLETAAGEAGDITATEPPAADQPWDPAIAASVEYMAESTGRKAPAWCDDTERFCRQPAIGAETAEEWAEALHGAAGAYIRHGVFPRRRAIENATGGPRSLIRGGVHAETTGETRAAARELERRLEADGLRGHVYVTFNTVLWFATAAHGRRRVLGPAPLEGALAPVVGNTDDARRWLEQTAETLRQDEWTPPHTWWDTPHLVITGTGPAVALGVGLSFPDEIDEERFDDLILMARRKSVRGLDTAARAVTGRPTSARAKETMARRLGQTLAEGTDGWLERWLAQVREALAGNHDPRAFLVWREERPVRWPWSTRPSCGRLEANLRAAGAPEREQGRLWIRAGTDDGGPKLVLLDPDDSEVEIELDDGDDVARGLLDAEGRRRHQPEAADGAWRESERPGWANIAGLAQYMAAEAFDEPQRRVLRAPRVVHGRLELTADDPPPGLLGLLSAARTLSGETCELCGRKGDPVADGAGRPAGCRCPECRRPDAAVLRRDWPAETAEPDGSAGETGDGRAGDGKAGKRLETRYGEFVTRLMRGDEDHGRGMWLWTRQAGWAGLIRALFMTLRTEQDERPDDPGHHPFRLGGMKEKWGTLTLERSPANAYQDGVIRFIEMMSRTTCTRCGRPARMRYAGWVRPECDECWTSASIEDREKHAKRIAEAGEEPAETGYRVTRIGPHGYSERFGLSMRL